MEKKTFTANAPAKVNLNLRIVGRRDDGYHLIDSLFCSVADLYDTVSVTFQPGQNISLKVIPSNVVPEGEENICWQAAKKLISTAGIEVSVEIELVKRIPIAAGLGGGSSDAAMVLLLINDFLYEVGRVVDTEELYRIALSLGADVPYFLEPRLARVGGIGESIDYVDSRAEKSALLICPNFGISASEAYELFRQKECDFSVNYGSPKIWCNDLQAAVSAKYVAVEVLAELIQSLPGVEHSAMSGSGPVFFALFKEERYMHDTEAFLLDNHPHLRLHRTSISI